jgi:hypothetical protein
MPIHEASTGAGLSGDQVQQEATNAARRQIDGTDDLEKVHNDIIETDALARKTGVPNVINVDKTLSGSPINEYHETESAVADVKEHGVGRSTKTKGVDFLAGGRGEVEGISALEISDAMVGDLGPGRVDSESQARVNVPTGRYTMGAGVSEANDRFPKQIYSNTIVERSDGQGGAYRGSLGDSAKAAAIVGKRANEQVRAAVVDRAISIGDELKAERTKEQ